MLQYDENNINELNAEINENVESDDENYKRGKSVKCMVKICFITQIKYDIIYL